MKLPIDDQGWTILPISATAKAIYVSTGGNDTNDGSTASKAVKTLVKANKLLDPKRQNVVYLRCGDTFNESFGWLQVSGPSVDQPLILTSYGSGNRPIVKPSKAKGVGLAAQGKANIIITDINFINGGKAEYGIYAAFVSNLLIEGCKIEQYNDNLCVQAPGKSMSDVTIRRNVIVDNHSPPDRHSQGIYAQDVLNLTLEENVFDHNGWFGTDVKAIFNHCAYIKESCTGFVARGNIFSNASATGLQARGGGQVEGNLVLDCPVGITFGLVNGDGHPAPGGVSGNLIGNVVVGGGDTGKERRGIGIVLGNTKIGGGTTVSGNIIANNKAKGTLPAISVECGVGKYDSEQVGFNDTTVSDNIVYRWPTALNVSGELKPGQSGKQGINRITVKDNQLLGKLTGAEKLGTITPAPPTSWPKADAALDASRIAMLAQARQQRRGNWALGATAAATIATIRAAFDPEVQVVVPAAPRCLACCPVHCSHP